MGDSSDLDTMVQTQIQARGVHDPSVLAAMRTVPRAEFVPPELRERAFEDGPLAIGHGQTISQPYVVAAMSEALHVRPGHRVLEVGTGSGYQAAVLVALGAAVFGVEVVPELAAAARERLARLALPGPGRVTVTVADGYRGLPAHAPFDRIVVTAAPPEVPQALVDQLVEGGRMVLPVGDEEQWLVVVEKRPDGPHRTPLFPVRFVPMVPSRRP